MMSASPFDLPGGKQRRTLTGVLRTCLSIAALGLKAQRPAIPVIGVLGRSTSELFAERMFVFRSCAKSSPFAGA